MANVEVQGVEGMQALVEQEIGPSEWRTVTQEDINAFAALSGDDQWIHVDVEKAKHSPFKSTIAHGFLTLSLLPLFTGECVRMPSVKMGINYGTNKVRFITPVPVGSRLRGRFAIKEVEDIPGGVQVVMLATIEIEGADKPACVAESVTRRYE